MIIPFHRDHGLEDRRYVRNAIGRNTPCDWAMGAQDRNGWRSLFGRTWSGDVSQDGTPLPVFVSGTWNGETHRSLLSYGKIREEFRIVAKDGRVWIVDAVAADRWGRVWIKTRFLGRFDYRAA